MAGSLVTDGRCIACGVDIPDANGRKRYCGDECRERNQKRKTKQCREQGCPTLIENRATYCSAHRNQHATRRPKNCTACDQEFTPASGNQERCPVCLGKLVVCPGVAGAPCGNVKTKQAEVCKECRERRIADETKEAIRRLATGEDPRAEPWQFPVLWWMVERKHTFSSAADDLRWANRNHFQVVMCPWLRYAEVGISRATYKRLADGLGNLGALRWSVQMWDEWFTHISTPPTHEEALARNYTERLLPSASPTRFSQQLYRRMLSQRMSWSEFEQITGLPGWRASYWISGRKGGPPGKPRLHHLLGLARLWTGPEANTAETETALGELSELIYTRQPSNAGLFLLHKLGERGMSMFQLGRQSGRAGPTLYRLLWEGRATDATLRRIGKALNLDEREQREFVKLEKRHAQVQPAAEKRREEGDDRRRRYWAEFEYYAARNLNPKARLIWGKICKKVGGSRTTAYEAHEAWLSSSNCTNHTS